MTCSARPAQPRPAVWGSAAWLHGSCTTGLRLPAPTSSRRLARTIERTHNGIIFVNVVNTVAPGRRVGWPGPVPFQMSLMCCKANCMEIVASGTRWWPLATLLQCWVTELIISTIRRCYTSLERGIHLDYHYISLKTFIRIM